MLSGYLITSLLLREREKWGRIDLIRFWTGRARRLLPGLIAMLLAVSLLSFAWVIPARRSAVSNDVFAAFLYVANWHLLSSDDSYFSTLSLPSPVLHTWSLAIEEQFYVVFPLLMIGLLFILHQVSPRRRRTAMAVILALLAAVSALWMAHLYVPGATPDRVYYGTDTRAFELLVGAVAALVVTLTHRRSQRWTATAAWPLLGVLVLAFVMVDENDAAVFRGGMFGFCVLAAVVIVAAAQTAGSPFERSLGWEPLRRIGVLSYSLYLWHWPVIVFLNADRLGFGGFALGCVQLVVSAALATASHRWIEQPVHDGGLSALLRRRPKTSRWLATLGVVALVAAAAVSPRVADASVASAAGGNLSFPQTTAKTTPARRVVLIGNSVPDSLVTYFNNPRTNLQVQAAASFGCDPFDGNERFGDTYRTPPESCLKWRSQWPEAIRSAKTDLAVYMTPQNLVSDYKVDGKLLIFGSAAWRSFLSSALDGIRKQSLDSGATQFAVMTLACHDLPLASVNPEFKLINDTQRVRRLNDMVKAWAASTNTPVIDLYGRLCPGNRFHGSVNGVSLYDDGFHFNQKSGPIVWRWLAPEVLSVINRKG